MKTAAEVMKRSFFHATPSDTIGVLLHEMAERGLGCVPVLDSTGRPLGVATTGEIERCYDIDEVIERLERPAVCMDQNTPVDMAARALAEHPACCLVLVDPSGVAVGALSPMDLLGAVLRVGGAEDKVTEGARDMAWEHAEILELGAAHRAPAGPGVILLSPGFDESNRRRVWAESAANMRERLDQMLREPQDEAGLEAILEVYPRTVRFRCMTIEDEARRKELADALCNVERASERAPRPAVEPDVRPPSAVVAPRVASSATLDS